MEESKTPVSTKERLCNAAKTGMYPFSWLCNRFLSSFRSTTLEEKGRLEDPCYKRFLILSFLLPFYAICIVLYAPIAGVCCVCWIILQQGQPSHRYFISQTPTAVLQWKDDRVFQISSINTYLMPEYSARYYNLGNTQERAEQIGNAIVDPDNLKAQGIDNVAMQYDSDSELDFRIEDQDEVRPKPKKQGALHKVATQFPKDLDVVCLQGVFEQRAHKKLREKLRGKFAHVVSDCEVNSWSTNRFRWPSGLVTASRWPILDACFKPFSSCCAWDKNVCKGVLIVKVPWSDFCHQKRSLNHEMARLTCSALFSA